MPRLLIQAGTGRQFIWTAALAERPDMTDVEPEPEPEPNPEPVVPVAITTPIIRRLSGRPRKDGDS